VQKRFAEMIAEFVGTFALMFIGGASVVHSLGNDLLMIAFAHGIVLVVMVGVTMHVSGAQLNPAVSIALVLNRLQPVGKAFAFIIAQLLGGIVGAWLLSEVFPIEAVRAVNYAATLGSMTTGETAVPMMGLLMEIIASFFLMFVIMSVVLDQRGLGRTKDFAGIGIGGIVFVCILCFGPVTGASMNPCRSFGPALVGGVWDSHWVYWVGPIIGATIGAAVWKHGIGLGTEDAD